MFESQDNAKRRQLDYCDSEILVSLYRLARGVTPLRNRSCHNAVYLTFNQW